MIYELPPLSVKKISQYCQPRFITLPCIAAGVNPIQYEYDGYFLHFCIIINLFPVPCLLSLNAIYLFSIAYAFLLQIWRQDDPSAKQDSRFYCCYGCRLLKKIKLGPSNKRKPVQLELKCDIPSSVLFLNRFECTLQFKLNWVHQIKKTQFDQN